MAALTIAIIVDIVAVGMSVITVAVAWWQS